MHSVKMNLKLSDVEEVHLCNIAIVWFSIVLRDVCKKQNEFGWKSLKSLIFTAATYNFLYPLVCQLFSSLIF